MGPLSLLLLSLLWLSPKTGEAPAGNAQPAPLDLVIIVDKQRGTPTSDPAIRQLPATLTPRTQDRVALVFLDKKPKVRSPLDSSVKRLSQFNLIGVACPWQRGQTWGAGGRLYDALVLACALFPPTRDPHRQRAVLLLSEDRERGSKADDRQALAALRGAHASLFLLRDEYRVQQPPWQLPRRVSLQSPVSLPTAPVEPLVQRTDGMTETSSTMSLTGFIEAIRARKATRVAADARTGP